MTLADRIGEAVRRERDAYSADADEPLPLGSYLATMGAYGAWVATGTLATRLAGRSLPDRVTPWDVVLLGLATHKISRLFSKDSITSVLRAPFTRYEGLSGESELAEQVRGGGLRRAVGELVTCPFCLGLWVATGLGFGLVWAPRATRLVGMVAAAKAAADFLQLLYAWSEQKAT